MIDDEITFREKGYRSTDLVEGSGKKVWAVCDNPDCEVEGGRGRWVQYANYRDLCVSCGHKTRKFKDNKITCSKCGEELLIGVNWTEHRKKRHNYWCKECYKEYKTDYVKRKKQSVFSEEKQCNKCGVLLEIEKNWNKSDAISNYYVCKNCKNIISNKGRYRRGERGKMYKNKECSHYLGVVIAEKVLSKVFKNVKKMPHNYPGYDLVCNKGYKVDVKSTVVRNYVSRGKNTCQIINFHIRKNKIADYFLCLAFDNRENLNPLYCWLFPGKDINDRDAISISPDNNKKLLEWKKYEVDLDSITECCDALRGSTVDVEYTPINDVNNRVLIESK